MSIFDIILTAVLLFSLVHGFISGIIKQIGIILGLVLGILFTNLLSPHVTSITAWASGGKLILSEHVSYITTFVIIFIAANIAAALLHKMSQALKIAWLDHLGGAVFGFVKYLLIISVALNIYVTAYNFVKGYNPVPLGGKFYDTALSFAPKMLEYAKEYGIGAKSEPKSIE